MYITSISLSYVFLSICVISLIFFLYFKIIVVKTTSNKPKRDKIIGKMKNPELWRTQNNRISLISLLWSLISLAAFIYLKFFYKAGLISIIYLLAFIAVIVVSNIIFLINRKTAK